MEDRSQEQSEDATITPEGLRATAHIYAPRILIRRHLWPTWAEIGIDEEPNARADRPEDLAIVEHEPGKERLPDALLKELKASLVSIAAASHSLDALYGVLAGIVLNSEVRRIWRDKGTRRSGQVFETLKRAVDVDARTRERWDAELDSLFDTRDAAVHFRGGGAPAPHPSGTKTGAIHNTYGYESAKRAVTLLLDVLAKPWNSRMGNTLTLWIGRPTSAKRSSAFGLNGTSEPGLPND